MKKKKIIIRPEWVGQFPIWHNYLPGDFPDGEMPCGPLEPNELAACPPLTSRLWEWSRWYDSFFDREDPANSEFPTSGDEENFWHEGIALYKMLQQELGDEYEIEPCKQIAGRLNTQE